MCCYHYFTSRRPTHKTFRSSWHSIGSSTDTNLHSSESPNLKQPTAAPKPRTPQRLADSRTDNGHDRLALLLGQLMGRQLADLWLRNRDFPPLDQLDRVLCLELPARNLPERRLSARLDLVAVLPALRRRMLASNRSDLPRPVFRCVQLHKSQVEAHA
jgi:hypothetical protein